MTREPYASGRDWESRKIARVFPRRTNATPTDELAFIGEPGLFVPAVNEVHVSVTWTYDLARAEGLVRVWSFVAPVKIGGPATGEPGGEFMPGLYVKAGYVITSRGCPNRCWFCSVWRREGNEVRELEIKDGWNVLDDNLLACSDDHVRAVFAMLARQNRRPDFSGGLEAARLKGWQADALAHLRPAQVWFAYDEPADREPFLDAVAMLKARTDRQGHWIRCYVLIGYPRDTIPAARARLDECYQAGVMPQAMLFRDEHGRVDHTWRRFQRKHARAYLAAQHMIANRRPCPAKPDGEPVLELEV